MKRISVYTERRIIELWFKGVLRDKIAQQTGVSGFTVSEIVNRFPKEFQGLRRLAVEIEKLGASVPEALEGVKLMNELAELGVEREKTRDFIQLAKKMGKDSDYEPKKLVQYGMKLSSLEKESGTSYSKAIDDFESLTRSVKKRKEKKRKLDRDVRDLENKNEKQLAENARALNESVQLARENKSLRKSIAFLKHSVAQESFNLQNLQRSIKEAEYVIAAKASRKSELNKQVTEEKKKLSKLGEDIAKAEQKEHQTVERTAALLQVEPEARKIVETMVAKEARLGEMDAEIAQREEKILTLEQRKQVLEKKNKEKEDRLAVADTLTDFIIGMGPCDFDHLRYFFKMLEQMRERSKAQPNLQVAVIEEEIRSLLQKAFKGVFFSTAEHLELKERYRIMKEENRRMKETIESATKPNMEGKSLMSETSINRSAQEWEEIEQLLKEKCKPVSVGTSGVQEILFEKNTRES